MGSRNRYVIVFLLGIGALAATSVFGYRLVREWYYLSVLDSEDVTKRSVAATRLGELGSTAAIPRLLELLRIESFVTSYVPEVDATVTVTVKPPELSYPAAALADSGVPAILNLGELAAWLDVPTRRLTWLADSAYRERQHDSTKLQNYHYSWRQKRCGSRRLIESPKQELKAVQRSLLKHVLDPIRPHSAAHGFCIGRSLRSFAAPHVAQNFVLAMDLEAFFASVSLPRVRAVYRAIGYPDSVASIFAALSTNVPPETLWKNSGRVDSSSRERWFYDRPHLPQGAPTSPALANLCARRLDCRLSGLARWAGAKYSRYADDLVFSGGSVFRHRAERVHVYATAIAEDEGFRLNTRKTRRLPRSVRQEIAGVVVNEHQNLRRRDHDRLKATLHNCGRHGPGAQNHTSHDDFRNHLLGRIAWAYSLNPKRGQRLRTLYDKIPWPTG